MDENTITEPVTVPEAVVSDWLQRLRYAKQAKEPFDAIAQQCYSFYRKSGRFMWDDDFRKRFMGNIARPRFETTVNAAFEYVAIFGPYLIWDYPHRTVRPYEPLELDPALFGDPNDPTGGPAFQQLVQQQDHQQRTARMRCKLMERYLNYTPREQPQGLWLHSMNAVIDALVKGRGVLVPRTYQNPGSDRLLTGLFYESVNNLFIDPDCSDPLLETATWIAIRHQSTIHELEDRFNLPRGTLAEVGNLESAESLVMNNRPVDQMHRAQGRTNDIIVWYEIWSKCGIAGQSRLRDSELSRSIQEAVGDYVYMCVAPGVPWFLNAPPAKFHEETTEDDLSEMLGWPFPCYMDAKWPVSLLDFYPDTEGPWPLAPLMAGLGHLICLNVLTSAYVEMAYENRKALVGVLEGAGKEVIAALDGRDNPAIIKLKGDIADDVRKCVQFLNRPAMNTDILAAIAMEQRAFEKATGLVEFMYGAEQTQDRTARTTAAKEEKTAIRPEKMAKDVAAWQSNAATLEALMAVLNVQGEDLHPLIPPVLWDSLIASQDPEMVMREMEFVVEATDVRRPNRERELRNLQALQQQVMAGFLAGAQINGDPDPINAFNRALFRAMEQRFDPAMEMKPWVPQPPPPEVVEAQQMEMQAEQAKTESELQGKQMDLFAKQQDVENKRELAELKLSGEVQKLQIDATRAAMEMQQDRAQSQLDLFHDRALFAQNMEQREAEGQQKVRLMRQQAKAKPKPQSNGKAK